MQKAAIAMELVSTNVESTRRGVNVLGVRNCSPARTLDELIPISDKTTLGQIK